MTVYGNDAPIGYAWLIERYQLRGIPPSQRSFALRQGTPQIVHREGRIERSYPRHYEPGASAGLHLEFALKHEGFHLDLLYAVFERLDENELLGFIRSKPTGKYARKLWFLYEYLTGAELDLPDSSSGYVDLLPTQDYFEGPRRPSRRHRVVNNLLGDRRFAPVVRRTERLAAADPTSLGRRVREIVEQYDPATLERALSYLYLKETKSSFAIEREELTTGRMQRFGAALREVLRHEEITAGDLLDLHGLVVDPRFRETGFRGLQNYVGQTLSIGQEQVHFVPPRPEDVPELMEGLLDLLREIPRLDIDPIVAAAATSFGFVFIHPFEDGNGRLHRCLIHWVLAQRRLSPPNVIFPVSAVMLARPADYDRCLETFSKPLLDVIDYDLDDAGEMTVRGETAHHYRYFDATVMAEALYEWVEATIEDELHRELEFLASHARAVRAMREVVDLPDKLRDRFIQVTLHNGFRLSGKKRRAHFSMLTDEEVEALEAVVRGCFGGD